MNLVSQAVVARSGLVLSESRLLRLSSMTVFYFAQGLPIGLMLIGKHYNESTIYRAAHAFEQLGDWRGF